MGRNRYASSLRRFIVYRFHDRLNVHWIVRVDASVDFEDLVACGRGAEVRGRRSAHCVMICSATSMTLLLERTPQYEVMMWINPPRWRDSYRRPVG